MWLIRTAKATGTSRKLVRTGIFAIILGLLVFSRGGIGGEAIPDWELATLYGGCWFDNPYCVRKLPDCPTHTVCRWILDKCRLCIPEIGERCKARRSYWPDIDGCRNGWEWCENAGWSPGTTVYGWCDALDNCNEDWWPTPPFPDCNDLWRYWCDD